MQCVKYADSQGSDSNKRGYGPAATRDSGRVYFIAASYISAT